MLDLSFGKQSHPSPVFRAQELTDLIDVCVVPDAGHAHDVGRALLQRFDDAVAPREALHAVRAPRVVVQTRREREELV